MTESVTNIEIEDVLSSIRRLVSEEARTKPELTQRDPLVLTAAQRVEEADGADETTGAETDAGESAQDENRGLETLIIKQSVGVSEKSASEQIDESTAQPRGGADAALENANSGEKALIRADNRGAADPLLLAQAEVHPDTPDKSELSEKETKSTTEDVKPESLEGKIAKLEALISETHEQWEPDEGSDDAYSMQVETASTPWVNPGPNTPPTQERDAEIEQAGAAVKQGSAEVVESVSDDSALLDEDTLREIVRKIIRQELQGSLGERVTENVRKLVRREIQRSKASNRS